MDNEQWQKEKDYRGETVASSRTVEYRTAKFCFNEGAEWAKKYIYEHQTKHLEKEVSDLKLKLSSIKG